MTQADPAGRYRGEHNSKLNSDSGFAPQELNYCLASLTYYSLQVIILLLYNTI